MNVVFADPSSNFHPYECDGPGKCEHCDRRKTWKGVAKGVVSPNRVDEWNVDHDPETCALCADDLSPTASAD